MTLFNSAFPILHSALEGWLPDMDLNHDKQIQSLLCYRYTIGQAGACRSVNLLSRQSSWQTDSILNPSNGVHARPHPKPLPQGEGEANRVSRKFGSHRFSHGHLGLQARHRTTIRYTHLANSRRMILPLLGERAGVRAVVSTKLSRITRHASL
jgi:hypothetical protein